MMNIKIPRLTDSIFVDQFLYMQIAGGIIGLTSPFFWWFYGFPAEQVLKWDFFLAAQVGGQMVGLVSFVLISTVIRPHLKLLANNMREIAEHLQDKNFDLDVLKCSEGVCSIDVSSKDEIGVSANAYNKLLDALLKSHDVEKVLNQFSKVMSENLEESKLASDTIELLIRSTHVEGAAIMVTKNAELKLIGNKGIKEAKKLMEHDEINHVLKTGQASYIELPKQIDMDGVLTTFKPSEVFVEPIEFKGVNLGVFIAATGAKMADDRTVQLISFFSRSIGLAVNNAVTHTKFQMLAAVDSLTNVYNRRYGMDRLREDYSRAVREQANMTLAMVDIDHFKKVNDTYGHLVGDKAIVLIANILKSTLRKGDIVIRYGGEEFMIILHGTSYDNAKQVFEGVRHKIMDTLIQEKDQQIKLTVSIGMASYPDLPFDDEVDMIAKADEALYYAKQTGRNRVVDYSQIKSESADKV